MSKIILNQQQEEFAQKAVNWYKHSSSTLLELAGYAGTGKSVVISEILHRLNLKEHEVLPMAYTGQACTIMRMRGLSNACTCHSGLFTMVKKVIKDDKGKPLMNKKFNTPVVTWGQYPKNLKSQGIKLIIIDEAWMVPIEFKKYIDDTGIKVIATGDPGQLPPVKSSPGYLVNEGVFFLTELMRQSANSPIVYLASLARSGIDIPPGQYGNDAMVIFEDEVNMNMIANSQVILCGTNKTRDKVNNIVRHDILRINKDYPLIGERVICRKNNWEREVDNIPLVNGLTGYISRPPEIGRFNKDIMKFDFQPDLLRRPFTDIEANHSYINANYIDREMIKNSRFTEGDLFEYAYGSTVHLSQGSEYNDGMYVEEYTGPNHSALNYTAITRFKNKMIFVKEKHKYWVL